MTLLFLSNQVEPAFTERYFENNPITLESVKKYYKIFEQDYYGKGTHNSNKQFTSLSLEFDKYLDKKSNAVTQEDFNNFNNRFRYCGKNKENRLIAYEKGKEGNSMFARQKEIVEIGYLRDGNICNDNDIVIAKYSGTLDTYHIYMWCGLFAGTTNDIVSQIPDEYMKDGKNYLYTKEYLEEILETHHVCLTFYEIINDTCLQL
jgi:hypothetical protein